ncbi:Ras guanine nucleotide exchange factor bud5, partial [Coemansia sp. RSA 1933]
SNLEPKELLLNSLGRVSYGTWKGLIIYLTSSHQNADDFVSKFMLSFRSFATPKDLAEALVARARNVAHADPRLQPSDLKLWHDRVQGPVQYTVFRVIQLWYTSYWNPAADDPLLTYLCAFILNEYLPKHSSRSHAGANENNTDNESAATTTRDDGSTVSGVNTVDDNARLPPPSVRTVGGASAVGGKLSPAKERMLAELNSYIDTQDRRPAASTSSPSMRSSSEEGPDISDLLMATVGVDLSYQAYRQTSHITHVNPLDVACQLTIIESSCYCMIQPAELINKEFSRGCQSCSVNVRQMSRWCTQITRWVSVLILSEATPERRCRMLKYAIQLGTHLLALKNYDGVMAIKAAIFSAAVMRLKLSWSLLPKKFDIMSKRLHEAMDSERNFANYRAMLHRSQPPLLPFLGLYLTDLTFLDDGNPTYRRFVLPHEVSQLNPQQQLSNQTSHDDSEKPHHHPSSNVSNSDPPSKQAPPRPADTEPLPQSSSTPQQQTPPAVQLTGQTCALFAKRDDVDLNSRSILINFEKSYRVATIIQEFQKFQVEYSGNFTMAIPGLQQYLIEQWDRCEAEGYDDDKIYSLSLQCEPRAACPISSGGANGADASTGRMSHHQPVQTAMRLTRLLPGAAQRLRGRDLSDTTLPSI